jgi:hypothetical protein
MKSISYFLIFIAVIFMFSCVNDKKHTESKNQKSKKEKVIIPDFNADSAYQYVFDQVAFGPRVPNTKEHALCADYLLGKLKNFSDTAYIQDFKVRAYNGKVLNGKNIIGSFQPHKKRRVLLCAHWDSRPYADYDSNEENHRTPIDGANDGASGVGVLLEIARQLQQTKPGIGIDIIFFDVEDYGPPHDEQKRTGDNWWALGSQYWAQNQHVPNYKAQYAILLDMVGAEDARFYYEGYSFDYAAKILKKVWKAGHKIGYGDYFIFEQAGYISDDHVPINEIANIPAIDIIHLDPASANGSFFDHWHTKEDTMDKIDKNSLKVVGQTLLTVIFEEGT